MLEYMIMPLRRYAQFTGRSRRMEFWAFALFNILVYTVISIAAVFMGLSLGVFANIFESGLPTLAMGSGMMLLFSIGALYWLAVLVPGLAVTVRRLHDRDMSGWWVLGFWLLGLWPLIGWLVSIAFTVILLLPGTPGFNKYGEDPKSLHGAEVFS